MLSTIVDNSTLTAVQRLIGDIGVALSFPIEGDVSAFDNYLQALLIYDEVAAIDDYKEEHRAGRHKRFTEVRFLSPSSFEYENINKVAREATEDITYRISRGRLASDPMARFLKSLDLHVVPAWYMQSSDWFLRLRILADEADVDLPKYGALMSSIRVQLREAEQSTATAGLGFSIENSDGRELDPQATGDWSISGEIKQFAAGLNWIAQRALFYAEAAETLKSAFTLHPIRHTFLGQYAIGNLTPDLPADARVAALDFFKTEVGRVKNDSDSLLGVGAARMKLPFFAAWAVGYAGNPRDGYDHVLQIRDSVEARALRSRFRDIEELSHDRDIAAARKSIAKLHRAIRADIASLSRKFGSSPDRAGLDASVDLLTLTPSITVSGLLGAARSIAPSRTRRATTVLRSISRDIMSIPTFGDLSDRFARSRRVRKGTGYNPENPRIEPRRFERSSTDWKQPL